MNKYCLMALGVIIFCYTGWTQAYDLTITEIFFDGTDEWIEITNVTDGDFSGSIELVGIKSSPLLVDVSILSGQSIVIGDQGSHITAAVSGYWSQGLSITDTKAISIKLYSSGVLLDAIDIETGTVIDLNDTKSSLHQILASGSLVPCTQDYSTGVDIGYCANPGLVFIVADSNDSPSDSGSGSSVDTGTNTGSGDTDSGNINSGGIVDIDTGSVWPPGEREINRRLVLSEVFIDGTDERVEITNIGTGSFSGEVVLEGAKSSALAVSLTIQGGESLVLADKDEVFLDKSLLAASGLGLSMLDTHELYIRLLVGEEQIDTFYVSESDTKRFDNHQTSFEKVLYSGSIITTYTTEERITNVISGYVANPGVFSELSALPEILIPSDVIRDCPDSDAILEIAELSKGIHGLSPFIEIHTSRSSTMTLVLSGSLLASPVTISLPSMTGGGEARWVLSNTGGFALGTRVLTADIQWLSGGQLLIYGQSGQLLDNIYIEEFLANKSYYPEGTRQGCLQYLEAADQPTPGLPKEILSYFVFGDHGEDEPSVGGCAPWPEFIDISIRGIVADPEGDESEKILLRLDRGAQHLNLDGYYLIIGSRKRYLKGDLSEGITQSIEQNFAFPNTRGECVTLYDKADQALDDICYPKEMASGFYRDMSVATSENSENQDDQEPDISIVDMVYDPPGNDTNKEIVQLQNNNSLSYEAKDLWLQVGDKESKTYLYGSLRSNEEKNFVGNYRLPNTKATCVNLMYGNVMLDTYCYDPGTDQKANNKKESDRREHLNSDLSKVQIELTGVVYDPDGNDASRESITFVLSKGRKINLSDFYLLIGKRKRMLEGILTDEKPLTITKTWGLANNAIGCITLMHQDKPYANYCYDPNVDKLQPSQQSDKDWDLTIADIEYDPPGRDENAEHISIENRGQNQVNMADIQIVVNKKKLVLSGVIEPGQHRSWTGSYHFPNAGACVSLLYQQDVLDSRCYGNRSKKKKAFIQQAKIVGLQYDPPGSDIGYESISLEFDGKGSLDLGQEAYLVVNDRKKMIKGVLYPGIQTTFTANFSLPNTKGCVDLVIHDHVYDSYCYGAKTDKGSSKFHISRVLADPKGKDEGKEIVQVQGRDMGSVSGLSLYINGKKKNVSRELEKEGLMQTRGSLGLTNSFGCVALYLDTIVQDQRCYYNSQEGARLTADQDGIQIDPNAVSTINNIALVDAKNEYCLSIEGHHFSCKAKAQKITSSNLESRYKSYISTLHSYLYSNRPSLYFRSDIARYRQWYAQATEQLRSGSKTIAIGGKEYKNNNFTSIVEDQKINSYLERAVRGIEEIQGELKAQDSL